MRRNELRLVKVSSSKISQDFLEQCREEVRDKKCKEQ